MAEFGVALVLGEHQGCPNAVLEALAAAVPVVANDSGGTRELIINGRTGILLRGRDADGIASALRRLIEDPPYARRLGENGRRHVQRSFSMEQMRAAYCRLFDAVSVEPRAGTNVTLKAVRC
jgi:glycosyltransferase involved in cell wall biosynthesis